MAAKQTPSSHDIVVSLKELVESEFALKALLECKTLSGVTTWKLARLGKLVFTELETFGEAKLKLIKNSGQAKLKEIVDPRGNKNRFWDFSSPEAEEQINLGIREVMRQDVTLPRCEKFTYKEIYAASLAPDHLMFLLWMIYEPTNEDLEKLPTPSKSGRSEEIESSGDRRARRRAVNANAEVAEAGEATEG